MTAPKSNRPGLPTDEMPLPLLAMPFLLLAAFAWLTSGEHGRGLVAAAVALVWLAVSVVKVRRFWQDVPGTQPEEPVGDNEDQIVLRPWAGAR